MRIGDKMGNLDIDFTDHTKNGGKTMEKPWENHGKSCGEDARSTLTIN
jgi:hypothetical protein